MTAMLVRLLAAPLARALFSAFRSMQGRKLTEARLRAEAEKAARAALSAISEKELRAARDVVMTELRGKSALQRDWRAFVAVASWASYWHAVVVVPHLVAWGVMTPPRFGERGLENLFWLAVLGMGGYMGGHMLERTLDALRRRRR